MRGFYSLVNEINYALIFIPMPFRICGTHSVLGLPLSVLPNELPSIISFHDVVFNSSSIISSIIQNSPTFPIFLESPQDVFISYLVVPQNLRHFRVNATTTLDFSSRLHLPSWLHVCIVYTRIFSNQISRCQVPYCSRLIGGFCFEKLFL